MDVSSLSATPLAIPGGSQQLPAMMATQVTLLREMAEEQQQIAQMLAESGLGQTIDVSV